MKKRGLSFISEKTAYELLEIYGYYNIINGYKEPYISKSKYSEQYKPGVTFEQIYSLFCLDHAIRNELMLILGFVPNQKKHFYKRYPIFLTSIKYIRLGL